LNKAVTQNKSYTVIMKDAVEMTASLFARTCLTPFTPLLDSRIDNVLVRTASELNQPLFQFNIAGDVFVINMQLYAVMGTSLLKKVATKSLTNFF